MDRVRTDRSTVISPGHNQSHIEPVAILKTARARECPRGFESHTLR
jgi:hypothetical protein